MNLASHKSAIACSLTLSLCAACGRGGSTGTVNTPLPDVDSIGPTASIHFPGARSIVDQDTITITGTAADPSGVSSLSVNGVPATSETRFTRWTAQIPLVPGENVISISSTDSRGNVSNVGLAGTVRYVGPYLARARDSRLLGSGVEAILVDSELDAVLAVDLVNGRRRVISAAELGTGQEFMNPRSIALYANDQRALVLDPANVAIFDVDMVTGDRTEFATNLGVPNGSYFFGQALTIDEASNRAFVSIAASGGAIGIFQVDLTTGTSTPFSTNDVGSGPDLSKPTDLELDATASRLFVTDVDLGALVSIDTTTGARTTIASQAQGEGVVLLDPRSPRHDSANNLVYVIDAELEALVSIDLTTGDRMVISDATNGNGPALQKAESLALEASLTSAFVTLEDGVVSVDLATGDRLSISNSTQGSGPALPSPSNAYGHVRQRSIVVQGINEDSLSPGYQLFRVNLDTGNRDVIATNNSGTGVEVLEQFSFECDRLLRRAVALGRVVIGGQPELAVYTIDLASSNRTLNYVFPSAPVVLEAADVEYDATNSMAFVGFEDQIWQVDLEQGTAEILTGLGVGFGPDLVEIRRMVLDVAAERLLVTDIGRGAVFRVGVNSGTRAEVSGPLVGSGPLAPGVEAIDIDHLNRTAAFTSADAKSIYLTEISTGERTLVFDGLDAGSVFPNDRPSDVVLDVRRSLLYATFEGALDAVVVIELETLDRAITSR